MSVENSKKFFEESTEQSRVKAEIVANYFFTWATVMMPSVKPHDNKIAYIDLYSGPGRYNDGTKSTPLLILERALNNSDIRDRLVAIFNDGEIEKAKSLENAIFSIPNIDTLKYKPQIHVDIVDEKIAEIFKSVKLIPSLTFLDPWGYKGLSCELIKSLIKDWGCDCIIFFNYNRINMGINNELVRKHMVSLFGEEQFNMLKKQQLASMSPLKREEIVLSALSDSLESLGGKYILPFRFRGKNSRISHHLVFVTKHIKGYNIMKDIMAKSSSSMDQDVPSFEYTTAKKANEQLYMFDSPLEKLEHALLNQFNGKSISMLELYNQHNVGTCYIKKNYKRVLLRLEEQGKIITKPPLNERKKQTFGDNVMITFPTSQRSY